MHAIHRQSGFSLVSLMVALGLGAVVLAVMSTFLLQTERGEKSLANKGDIVMLKSDLLSRIQCEKTYYPGGVYASQCENGFSYNDTACGTAPYMAPRDQSGNPIFAGWNGSPKAIGNFQVRSCCPGGSLKLEYRIMKNGAPLKDPQNPGVVYDWQTGATPAGLTSPDKGQVFPLGSPCGKLLTTISKKKQVVAVADLKLTIAACPGYPFMETPLVYLQTYEGVATCPKDYKLVGGWTDCDGMGPVILPKRSGTADSHPLRESGMGQPDWVSKAKSYAASCCGGVPHAGSLKNRVMALCEEE